MSLIGKIIKIKDAKYVVEGEHEDTLLLKKIKKAEAKSKKDGLILKLNESFVKTLEPADSLVYGKQLGYSSEYDINYPESLYDMAFDELKRIINGRESKTDLYYIDDDNKIQKSCINIVAFDPADEYRVLVEDNTEDEKAYKSFRIKEILKAVIFTQECKIADQLLNGKIKLKNTEKSISEENSETPDDLKDILDLIFSKVIKDEDILNDLLKQLSK